MNRMLENYINGNLTDARNQAKRFGRSRIVLALMDQLGYSRNKATVTAYWLKTGKGWQAACDAK